MQAVLRIDGLPSGALDAAAKFHQIWLPKVRETLSGDADSLALVLPPAPVDHRDWRRGVARDLARELAPKRINLIAGDDAAAIAEILGYLEHAPGVTGQLLPVDSHCAGIRARRTDG
jgi:hypothetical protein